MSDSTILCNRRPLPAAASPEIKKVLTIAGSDSSGGAGIQADIKTITAHKMYAMSAITSLTAQNTLGVKSILDAAPEFVADELDCIFQDIRPDAVKIGMVSQAPIIEIISAKLREYQAENIVVDPVMVATSGSRLLSPDAMAALQAHLLPLASIITPNIPEAEVLTGRRIVRMPICCSQARSLLRIFSVLYSSKAAISPAVPMTCCVRQAVCNGSNPNVSLTKTPTAQAARFPAPLPAILLQAGR